MFVGFTNPKASNKQKLLPLSNLPLLFCLPPPFLGKNVPPFFGESTELQSSSTL